MKKKLYTIGDVSNICGINKRNLRFYDDKGLIVPSSRDESNNYRYYSEEDVMDAIIVKELRKKGLKISEMKDILKKRNLSSLEETLSSTIKSLEKELSQLQKQLEYTKNKYDSVYECLSIYEDVEKNGPSISIGERESNYVIYTKYKSRTIASELFWDRLVELDNLAEDLKVDIVGPFTAIFHEHYFSQFFFEEGLLEVFYPVSPPDFEHENIKKVNGYKEISTIYIGEYKNALQTYVDLINYAESQKIEIIGHSMEEYLCDFPQGLNEKNSITRISFPIKLG